MINYPKATIAIIGGSGLYEMEGLTGAEPVNVDTPYGNPSDAIMVGELDGVSVAFLPRHGKGHRFNPDPNSHQGKHLCIKIDRRRTNYIRQRSRKPKRGINAPRSSDSGPID